MSGVLGIDPGTTGYIVSVDSDGIKWFKQNPKDLGGFFKLLRERDEKVAFVEIQHAMHKQGVVSMFTLGTEYGRILEAVAGLGIRLELVLPKDWQKVMLRGEPKVAKGKELKKTYVRVASRLWPTVDFYGPKGGIRDGLAAAALIAEYGRRRIIGE